MKLAKVFMANGQITIPLAIRRALHLKPGNKVLFQENEVGQISISNASSQAISKAQSSFEGVAQKMGVKSADEIQVFIDEIRYGK